MGGVDVRGMFDRIAGRYDAANRVMSAGIDVLWRKKALGLLLDAKKRGLISAVAPLLDELDRHKFNLSPRIRESILNASGETP